MEKRVEESKKKVDEYDKKKDPVSDDKKKPEEKTEESKEEVTKGVIKVGGSGIKKTIKMDKKNWKDILKTIKKMD